MTLGASNTWAIPEVCPSYPQTICELRRHGLRLFRGQHRARLMPPSNVLTRTSMVNN